MEEENPTVDICFILWHTIF